MALSFIALCLSACGNNLSTTQLNADDLYAAHQSQNVSLKEKTDTLLVPMVTSGHTPGVIAGILLPDSSMHFYSYGVADKETDTKMNADTLFPVGSLSKGYLAAITALLVDRGVISWNDTLPRLLPPGTALSPDAAKITLLQLATHTSGLPRQPLTSQTLRYFVEYLFDGESFYRHFDQDYILTYLADFEADNAGVPRYSNIGYGLLSYILELKTGKSVDTLLKEMIVGPLKLKCTGYAPELLPCNDTVAHGYAGDEPMFIQRGNPTPDWEFTHLMRGAAAMHSTARELLVFAKAHMHKNGSHFQKILANDLTVRIPEAEQSAAIAWSVDDVDGSPIAYQIGIVAGYTSYLGIDTANNTAVVILQNSFNWDNSYGHKLLVGLRPHS